jgi:RNA polymerase sigma-70 factor (ECF subfamily)
VSKLAGADRAQEPRLPASAGRQDSPARTDFTSGSSEDRLRSLFETYSSTIFGYAVRAGLSKQDAQDVLSEVFVVCKRRLEDVPLGSVAKLWLIGVARNVVRQTRRQAIREERMLGRLRRRTDWLPSRNIEQVVSSSQMDRLSVALDRLPPKEQEIVKLIIWEEMNHADAGKLLHCSPNASRIRYHRAITRLRESLLQDGTERSIAESRIRPLKREID